MSEETANGTCCLCMHTHTVPLQATQHPPLPYRHCPRCDLLFVTDTHILSPQDERGRYETHENTRENVGYVRMLRRFLDRAVLPFSPGSEVLEFGCGPGPVLADLLRDRGYRVTLYDPFFAANPEALDARYDLITATEVVEHVRDAAFLWRLLFRCTEPGGLVALTTRFHPGPDAFDTWWYRRDPTHVRFYSTDTLRWIANHLGWRLVFMDRRDTATLLRPLGRSSRSG